MPPTPTFAPVARGYVTIVLSPLSNPEIKMYLMPDRGQQSTDLTPQGKVRITSFESTFDVPAGLIQVTVYRSGTQYFKQVMVPAGGTGRVVFDQPPSVTAPEPVTPLQPIAPPQYTFDPLPDLPPFIAFGRGIGLTMPFRVVKGQSIPISAKVYLATTPPSPSSGEAAELIYKDAVVARSTTENGVVAFDWTVPDDAPVTFKICLRIPKNSLHPEYGDSVACSVVSSTQEYGGILEQKLSEAEEKAAGLAALRAARGAYRDTPGFDPFVDVPQTSTPSLPSWLPGILESPDLPTTDLPSVEPPAVDLPTSGVIKIPFIDIGKPGLFPDPKIYIDNEPVGAPPLSVTKEPGKHVVKVELKGFAPVYRTVQVEPGGTVILDNLSLR